MTHETPPGRSPARSAGPFVVLALTLSVVSLPAVLCAVWQAERSPAKAVGETRNAERATRKGERGTSEFRAPSSELPLPASAVPAALGPLVSIGEPASCSGAAQKPEEGPDWARQPYRIRRGGALKPFCTAAVKAACSAVNPNQRLVAFFGTDGVRLRPAEESAGNWRASLSLAAAGPAGRTTPAAEPELTFEGDRVELRRDGLVEWYQNLPHALVQGFTVKSAPGAGEVEIELAAAGTLTPTEWPGPAGGTVRLADAAGRPVLDCRDLAAADATGRELPVRRAERGGRLVLAASTAGATFPVTVRQQLIAASIPSASYEDQVTALTNQERWDNGHLAPLKRESTMLDLAAEYHCEDMIDGGFFSHTSKDGAAWNFLHFWSGEGPSDRMAELDYGWSSWAENIAAGFGTPAAVMNAWMNSSGHRANILSTANREIGVGYVASYWTQDFGTRSGVYPVVINREAHETSSTSVSLYVYGSGWASQMRFSNDGTAWTAWQAYATSKTWTLSEGDGFKTVYCQLKDAGATVKDSNDSIYLSGSTNGAPTITDFGPASPATVAALATQQFYIDCFDPDGDAMTYSWQIDGVLAGVTTNWLDYAPADADAGTHTIKAVVSDGHGHSTAQTWDVTVTTTLGPAAAVSPKKLAPACKVKHSPAAQSFQVWNCGTGTLTYTVTADKSWLSCTPAAGDSTGEHDVIAVKYATSGLGEGAHTATITVTDPLAVNPPQTVTVRLTINEDSSDGGGGNGFGCALTPESGSAGSDLGWAVPYLLVAGLYAAARLARRRRPALRA